MRALVIGADGFVGRWVVRHLAEARDELHAVVGAGVSQPKERQELRLAVDISVIFCGVP